MAHRWLDGLVGIEIGGSAHNPFGLDTLNVDLFTAGIYKDEERKLCGEALAVDIVAPGDCLPLDDKSFDFVLSSHVIEHIYDPIRALIEWRRVARKYIYTVFPHPDRTFDAGRESTTVEALLARQREPRVDPTDRHWNVWRLPDFLALCQHVGLRVLEACDPDDKVGNGVAVVCEVPI